MKTNSRPRILKLDQLGSAARDGVALAIADRVKRFGPQGAFGVSPLEPFTTVGLIAYPEPDPFFPSSDPYVAS
jgi:hypothetical protein